MKPSGHKGLTRLSPVLMAAAALLCVLALALFGGKKDAASAAPSVSAPSAPALPFPGGLRIAVASDTHLDPDNTDKSGDISETVYNMEIADAMLWDAREQGAELLLITGDLCNSGKTGKHEALVKKLRAAEEAGLTVFVLPGNHDLAPLRQTEFAALYADFGYEEAFSRDPASLSYCVLRDDLMLLLMDAAGYGVGAIDLPDAPTRRDSSAFLCERTLAWAEEMLREAHTRGLPVLAAGHFNLIPEISRTPGSGYYVENGVRFADLLRQYGVKLYLSGHMHLCAVYQEESLTEQLTGCLIAYPTAYTMLDLAEGDWRVSPRRTDVDAWAAASGQDDPVLLHFADWQEKALYEYCRRSVEGMSARNPIPEAEKAPATEFFYTAMSAYWDGSLALRRNSVRAMAGYEPFFHCAEGYSYGWWLKELIETASPLLGGYTLG